MTPKNCITKSKNINNKSTSVNNRIENGEVDFHEIEKNSSVDNSKERKLSNSRNLTKNVTTEPTD